MNEQPAEGSVNNKFPVKSLIATMVAIGLTGFCYLRIESLNEQFEVDMAMPTIVGAVGFTVSWMMWMGWAVFSRKSVLFSTLITLVPVLFLTLFYIDFGGDGEVSFRPRYWDWKNADYLTVENQDKPLLDLVSTTVYDFPEFLGPNRDLRTNQVKLAADWDTEPPQEIWQIDVGDAWSGFSVVNGFAITQEQRGAQECVTCYDVRTGELKWIYAVTRRHEDALAMGKVGPRATPTINEGFVYTTGGNGVLDCLDARDGSLLWSQDVPALVGIELIPRTNSLGIAYAAETSTLMWGRSCSPLVYQNLVIVAAGGPLNAVSENDPTCTLIAFDKKTGEEVWRGGRRQISYGSPNLVTIDGKPQIVIMAEDHAVGHDPETGKELWAFARKGSSSGEANCSQVTAVAENQLLVTKGYQLGGELLEVAAENRGQPNESWSVKSIGKSTRLLKTKMTNPVVIDNHAFALSDGFMSCVALLDEAPGLEKKWRERTRFKHGQILNVGDKILVHGQDGVLAMLQVNFDEYQQLGKIKTIDGFCWNTIALYGDLLLVRSERKAACYRLPIEGTAIAETQVPRKTDTDIADAPVDPKAENE
jgi:outer membrane protein assembly factor BamB